MTVKLSEPLVLLEPDQSPLAEQLDALLDDQVKVTLSLTLVEEVSNDKVTLTEGVGAGASPEEPPPPPPPHEIVISVIKRKLYFFISLIIL